MASILVVSGKSSGYYLELSQEKVTVVGREEGCDVQVLDDMVSRRHMTVRWDAKARCFKAADAGSQNGTFINGRQIQTEVPLEDNDAIVLGESKLFYTRKNFPDRDAAMLHIKQRGERGKSTLIQ